MATSADINSDTTVFVRSAKHYEDFTIIWLDEETDRNEDILYFKARVNYCKVFMDLESCTSFIYNLKEEKFFVIFSGDIHPFYIKILLEFPQITQLYVLSIDRNNTEHNDSNHDNDMNLLFDQHNERLRGPFIEKLTLFTQILQDMDSIFNDVNRTMPLSVFHASITENTLCDVTNKKPLFLWSQLLVEVLLHMDDRDEAKIDMSFTSRQHYNDNANVLKTIAGFKEDYQPELALHWYTKNSFVFRLVNKALRTQDIDIIFKFRFFIKDLQNQMTQLHETYCKKLEQSNKTEFTVYRGQIIGVNELISLQNNIDNIVATNSFFSTSINSAVACDFAGDGSCDPLYGSVLFQIHVSTNIKTKPFAKVDHFGVMDDEGEIIFSMGTIFKINSVELFTETIWLVDLSLIEQYDLTLHELFDNYKWEIEHSSSDILTLGIFLMHIGEYVRAIRYYELLSIQSNLDPIILICTYYNLAITYCEQGNYDQVVKYLAKCTMTYLLHFPNSEYNYIKNIALLTSDDNRQGKEFIFVQQQNLDTERALEEHISYVQHPLLASALFSQLAYIYHKTCKQEDAKRLFQNSVNIDKTLINDAHIDWYSYCAYDHLYGNDYAAALDDYNQTLVKYNTCLPSKQGMLGIIHYNMGELLFLNNRIDDAFIHYNLSLNIRQLYLPSEHLLLRETIDRIDSIRNSTLNAEHVKADSLIHLIYHPQPFMVFQLSKILQD